ncbi:hypothetical protein F3Y22_tig00116971pilonHSYRG00805 [Hibiscus syriacus]|uniref:Uncharacterized protein n=1 Tax=Hibiscus syriacus TaxID=106335 RepID=A0A6A2X8Z0_HIBSY|nr:hypothetical protein F3Y22_tig00116971pilonHSYRG00805 [Hibiscus syriacus]
MRDDNQKNSSLLDQYLDGVMKVHVRAVRRYDEQFEGRFTNPIIVCESSGKSRKDRKGNSAEFFADRVLQILARDMDCNYGLHTGILKPFTVFSAMLSIIADGFCPNNEFLDYGKVDSDAYVTKEMMELASSIQRMLMKQVKKCSPSTIKIPESAKLGQDATKEINHRPTELPEDRKQLASYSASAGEGFSRVLDEAVTDSQTSPVKSSDACASKAAVEVIELLLREPKDLTAMHKRKDPPSQASDSRSTKSASCLAMILRLLIESELLALGSTHFLNKTKI